MMDFQIEGNIVDIENRKVFTGEVLVRNGHIHALRPLDRKVSGYILPGFIDAHIHIESSMLIPTEFSRLAAPHGTVATVSDPHEIANVLGKGGIEFMIENGASAGLKFFFGASSCVPATTFETAGARMTLEDIDQLLSRPDILYLSEMMNYPGVINRDPEVLGRLDLASKWQKPVDGHAPGLKGQDADSYFGSGISTDHECFSLDEARYKASLGVKILIREGSAAKNYAALHPLLNEYPELIMFCSDDRHPDDLIEGHINSLVQRAVADGYDLYDVLWSACIHPVKHYKLPVGTLNAGDPADFIVVEDLENFKVLSTFIDGVKYAEKGKTLEPGVAIDPINQFVASPMKTGDFALSADAFGAGPMPVIVAIDHELITERLYAEKSVRSGHIVPQPDEDILKIAVVNRYDNQPPAVAFVKGFGLKNGAMASCVAHDSHNIIVIGTDDDLICRAVNKIIEQKGGIAAVSVTDEKGLSLPVAGIMSDTDGKLVARQYASISKFVKDDLSSTLTAPFMTLSFMALLVIPSLKISDLGLFDGETFSFVES